MDVTRLVEEGRGIESFRAMLDKEKEVEQRSVEDNNGGDENLQTKSLWIAKRAQDVLSRLQELSTMFSQEEADTVTKSSRGFDESSDSGSIRSGVHARIKNRNQAIR